MSSKHVRRSEVAFYVVGCFVVVSLIVQCSQIPVLHRQVKADQYHHHHHLYPPALHRNVKNKSDVVAHHGETIGTSSLSANERIMVAYAITVTDCSNPKRYKPMMDSAAVLKHSIDLIHNNNNNHHHDIKYKSKYAADTVAFIHPDAAATCKDTLQRIGYNTMIKQVPFHEDQVRGNYKNFLDKGCCGSKEWLKLYAYQLTDYKVVFHLDIDTLVLQPMDELINTIIIHNHETPSAPATPSLDRMWSNQTIPDPVDAFFTRDYNMVSPGHRQVHQIGVQGGFLVVRPDPGVFLTYVDLILEGNFTQTGWGGETMRYGGYWGGATIQGLASMMYSHVRPNTAIELNRCKYNNMGDNPRAKSGKCRTMETDCEDCRTTPLEQIRTVHFTECTKPWWCTSANPHTSLSNQCLQFHFQWFLVRESFIHKLQGVSDLTLPDRTANASSLDAAVRTFGACIGGYHQLMNFSS